jgi:hypothetical protein
MERRTEVVALEVREHGAHEERLAQRGLHGWELRAVVDRTVERRGRGKQAVEAAALRVIGRLDIRRSCVSRRSGMWHWVQPICSMRWRPACVADVCR